ncbi:MAG: hypothetical protein WCV59_01795 [Parcubacteria group bacterium]|jgi:hypothetical protein
MANFFIIFFLLFSNFAFAQCQTFDFTLTKNSNFLFFNCDKGEIEKLDNNNNISSVPRDKSLGGFVHNFIWSPDGTKALILSENVLAVLQKLELYSPQRELNSLNWWIYDLDTKKATLLDKKIISIGWASNDQVVYDWDNKNISIASINDPGFKKFTKLTDITGDSDDLNLIVSSVNMGNFTVFPMKKGFYAINSSEKKATYHPLAGGIQKIISDPFEQKYFIIKSGDSIYKYTPRDGNLAATDDAFSATDLAFLNSDSLVIVDTDGKVYSYDISTKTKLPITLTASGKVSRVFSAGNKEEFIFTIGSNIYRENTENKSSFLLRAGSEQKPTASSSVATQPSDNSVAQTTTQTSKIVYIILIALLIMIVIFVVLVVLKRRKRE